MKSTMSFEEYKMPTEEVAEGENDIVKKFIPFDGSANL